MNDQAPRYGRPVLIGAFAVMAVVLAANLLMHEVPWGLEHDGLFLVDTDHAQWDARGRPAGYVLLLRAAAVVFGSAFRAGHVLAALFGAGFVWSAYRLSWRLFRREDAAVFVAASLILFPRFLFSALLANNDAAFAFCGAMALAELFPAKDELRPVRLGLWLAATALVKELGLFLFFAVAVVLILDLSRPRRWAVLARTVAVFAVPILVGKLVGAVWLGGGPPTGPVAWLALPMHMLQLPPDLFAESNIASALVTFGFRVGTAVIEWVVELAILCTPLLPIAAVVVAFDGRDADRAGRVRRSLGVLFVFLLPLTVTAWRGDEQARYFLPFAPLLLGSLFMAVAEPVRDHPTFARRAVGALVLVLALTGLALKTAPPFVDQPRYYDRPIQGDRRHLSRAELAAAVDRMHAELGPATLFATNNAAFGLVDSHVIHYDWLFEGRALPTYDRSQKGSDFYRSDLAAFLCHVPAEAFLYDTTDRLVRINPIDAEAARRAGWLLQAVVDIGPVSIFRIDHRACDRLSQAPEQPVEPTGPPPSEVAPLLPPLGAAAPPAP
jgi:Dolichyl-phosphate-mannose-protein mannosyltransferase